MKKENNMSEEEIINRLTNPQKYSLIEIIRKFKREGIENFIITKPELLQGLLDLYQAEKEKNKKIEDKIKEKIEKLKGRKMDIVTSPVHNTDEKLKILEKDKIRKEILEELLEE
jgi:hypothetical protein